jgi:hypothetical protein
MDRPIVAVHECVSRVKRDRLTISQSPPLTCRESPPESVAPSTNCLEVYFGARVDWGQIRPNKIAGGADMNPSISVQGR